MAANTSLPDTSWIRQVFMIPGKALSDADQRRRTFSTASNKYTDTTLGGNYAINTKPQFTRFADLKTGSQYATKSKKMGRYYSEAIDDNEVKVHMRFGVAEHNSLTTFFTNIYEPSAGSLARTGESTSVFFKLGQVAGFIISVPLLPLVLAGRMYRFFTQKPYSKYYYLKPTMLLYWNAVNNICNAIAVNMGLVDAADSKEYEVQEIVDPKSGTKIPKLVPTTRAGLNSSDIQALKNILPDIYRDGSGGIDIYAVANRAQRMLNAEYKHRAEGMERLSSREDLIAFAQGSSDGSGWTRPKGAPTLGQARERYLATTMAQGEGTDSDDQSPIGTWEEDSMIDYFKAELSDGSHWITLNVNNEDNATESFSNSTKQSEIASKINSVSSSAREARFSTADGNLGDGALISFMESVVGSVKDIGLGALDGIGLSGLAVLGGSAFVDIPEHWDSSVYNAPSMSYSMELRTPYGNKMSIFTNLYVPLAMLIAGAVPLGTGKASYTSPFLVELFSKGRAQTRLGIIDSLTIKRGQGNVGWSNGHLPLGIDVSFSVKDLSTVMHMPVTEGIGLFDDDNSFTDYMAVLGSLGLVDQVYGYNKLKRNMTQMFTSFDKYTSPAYWSNWAGSTVPGRLMSTIANATGR